MATLTSPPPSQTLSTIAGPDPKAALLNTIFQFFSTRTLQVFAEMGFADRIAAGADSAEDLGGDPDAMRRFLAAAASIGLLRTLPGGRYALTPMGELLRSGVPGSMRGLAAILGGGHYTAWGHLKGSLDTGVCAFDSSHGEDIWSYFTKTQPEEGALFNLAMAASNAVAAQAILDSYQFPATGSICDVAGGNGSLLCTILSAYPGLRGTVMDLAFTVPSAEALIQAHGLASRCRAEAGDFFVAVPPGADIYQMKWILHDWNDQDSLRILNSIHKAMPEHARLLLYEAVVPEGDDDPGHSRLMDLNMLVMTGGRERTAAEWNTLLHAAGFRMTRIVPTPSPVSVIEAEKNER